MTPYGDRIPCCITGNPNNWRVCRYISNAYRSADPNFEATQQTNVVVYSNGWVTWLPPGLVKFSCTVHTTWFPFDDQECFLKVCPVSTYIIAQADRGEPIAFQFGSWTYNGYKVDLQQLDDGWDLSEYVPNGEWHLLGSSRHRLSAHAIAHMRFRLPCGPDAENVRLLSRAVSRPEVLSEDQTAAFVLRSQYYLTQLSSWRFEHSGICITHRSWREDHTRYETESCYKIATQTLRLCRNHYPTFHLRLPGHAKHHDTVNFGRHTTYLHLFRHEHACGQLVRGGQRLRPKRAIQDSGDVYDVHSGKQTSIPSYR